MDRTTQLIIWVAAIFLSVSALAGFAVFTQQPPEKPALEEPAKKKDSQKA